MNWRGWIDVLAATPRRVGTTTALAQASKSLPSRAAVVVTINARANQLTREAHHCSVVSVGVDPSAFFSDVVHLFEPEAVALLLRAAERDVTVLEAQLEQAQRRTVGLADSVAAAYSSLVSELGDFHDHAIDLGFHDCEGIPGGCTVLKVLALAAERTS